MDEQATMLRWAKGYPEAAQMLMTFYNASHAWDDIEDGDTEKTAAAGKAFRDLFEMRVSNAFYRDHAAEFDLLADQAIIAWDTANRFEKGGGNLLRPAFFLRSMMLTIIVHTAKIIGGPDWARRVSAEAWATVSMGIKWDEYMQEHGGLNG